MGIIKDILNLKEGAMSVQVTITGKQYKLTAHRIADGVVYFTPKGSKASKGMQCMMKQAMHSMSCIAKYNIAEKHVQIGLLMANLHEALQDAGAEDVQIKSDLERLLDAETFHE